MSIRPIDHTADVGVDIEAASLERLYERAARAFTDVVTDVDKVRPVERRRLGVGADDRELLMVEWLEELLFLVDTESFLVGRARVELRDEEEVVLTASVAGERFDPERHPVKVAIKGITYHDLAVRRLGERWRARVIFDI